MSITWDGWFDWAERVPYPSWKTNGYNNPGAGFVCHSAETTEAGLRGYASDQTRRASWNCSNLKSGHVLAHYPISAQCWTSGAGYPNNNFLGIEHEGFAGEPFTDGQHRSFARMISEVSALKGWSPIREATLWEHCECDQWGAAPTACPSHRCNWDYVMQLLQGAVPGPAPVQRIEEAMTTPYGGLRAGAYYVVISRGNDNQLWAKHHDGNQYSDWYPLPPEGHAIEADPQITSDGNVLDVTCRGSDDQLYHWWFSGGTWGAIDNLGGNWSGQQSAEPPRGRGLGRGN